MTLRFLLLLIPLLFVNLLTRAQILQLHQTDSTLIVDPIKTASKFPNEQELVKALHKLVPSLQEQGFLSASIDSIGINNDHYDAYYYLGQQYKWANLFLDSIPNGFLASANINFPQLNNKALNPKLLSQLSEKILQHCEENGYPFARVWLSNITEITPQKINAHLRLERAEFRKIDSIIIQGDLNISSAFVHRYLDIAKGSIYNEKKLKIISQRLRDLPFLQESSPWLITFRPIDTRLNLFLKEKKANQLNAILGLMPNNRQSNKLLLTADVQFALQNFLGYGESISASYQNLQEKSPRIKADVIVPYLLHSPIGAETHLDLFSSNLQFRKISLQTGIRYQISTTDLLKLFYQTISNRIIGIDTPSIIASRQLPANIDAKSNGIGLEIQSNHTDYRLNPKKGWQARIGLTALQRKVLKNNAIVNLNDGTGFDFNSLYDTLTKSSIQYHFSVELADYISIGNSVTLKLGYNAGYIAAPKIFQNELYQIGGFKLLRGFDEQSIFANQYHISITEFRLRFSQNSYAYLFSDIGWVETKFNNYDRAGWHNGFGLGTTLETKTGQFAIALAFGRSDQIPLRFRESKLTFGYIALF
jgi:outer membrane protein assembly factor BamA